MDHDRTLTANIGRQLREALTLHGQLETLEPEICALVERVAASYQRGGKLILFGNGGSAADAQHIAAELLGHFRLERQPWPAIALTTNTSSLTAISNDYRFEDVFARQVRAWAKPEDVVVGITTSGSSANVLAGLSAAREIGATTVGLCGTKTKALDPLCDLVVAVPSTDTPRIQEAHILIGHIVCEEVERILSADV